MEPTMLSPFAAKQTLGMIGVIALWIGLIAALVTSAGYLFALRKAENGKRLRFGRLAYAVTALSGLTVFGVLASLVYNRRYEFHYVFSHTGNDLHGWYRFAATWAGQEGSFLLWMAWTAVIGFLVMARAGKYEARVMPFYVTIIAFLCAILIKQSPFLVIPAPSAADLAAHANWHYPPLEGQGLNPSLVNYWMTIHPPTIFFGFASLAVPFCYAVAALLWKDYDNWMPRVMPYSLLSSATLGIGLFMGGYWAYETQGWHGFWAWDPVENASFFPWLAITALVHGAVVQKDRGGMKPTNTFLGVLAFSLFLLGTFLTRSGALAGKDANGQMLSVHAFDNISKSGLVLMIAMLAFYGGGGLLLWLARVRRIPKQNVVGESPISRDFAFVLVITLMLVACAIVTLGTTTPLFQSWTHRAAIAPKPSFYNKTMLPLTLIAAFLIGSVPWLAWRKTDPEKFLRKLLVPWLVMLVFGFFLVFWVQGAERGLVASLDPSSLEFQETMRAWINPKVQRIAVVALASLGFLAALSNAILAYRVFRSKPLSAGGWLAHVGIGLLIVGVIVSNTYERTERITIVQGEAPPKAFGYEFAFEKMTGKPMASRPLNPDYDLKNTVQLRITPPEGEGSSSDGSKTFLIAPRWFVFNMNTSENEEKFERMRWPEITKYWGHDLYVGFANDPGYELPSVTLKPGAHQQVGPYNMLYLQKVGEVGKYIAAQVYFMTQDQKIIKAQPGMKFGEGGAMNTDVSLPELADADGNPGAIYLRKMDPATREATFLLNLPGFAGRWEIPLEVTYKPWINLVWIGVLIATAGTLLAMVRRALEARKLPNTPTSGGNAPTLDALPVPTPAASTPTVVPDRITPTVRARKRPTPEPKTGT